MEQPFTEIKAVAAAAHTERRGCVCAPAQWLCRRRWVLKYKTNKQAAIYGESQDASRALAKASS